MMPILLILTTRLISSKISDRLSLPQFILIVDWEGSFNMEGQQPGYSENKCGQSYSKFPDRCFDGSTATSAS